MSKKKVVFDSKEVVGVTYEALMLRLIITKDALDERDDFELRDELCNIYRAINSLYYVDELIEGTDNDFTTKITAMFYEDLSVDTSYVDEDRLLLVSDVDEDYRISISHISKYKVVNGDVLVVGHNYKNFEWVIVIIDEYDWDEIQEHIQENKSRKEDE